MDLSALETGENAQKASKKALPCQRFFWYPPAPVKTLSSPVRAPALVPSLLLLLTAAIWGAAFLAQKLGAAHLGGFAFTAARSLLGGVSLFVVLVAAERGSVRRALARVASPRSLVAGLVCGAALFAASAFQQLGIEHTTPGVSAFLTAVYVLLVPVLGLFLGRRVPPLLWPGLAVALAGLYLICVSGESLSVGRGEALTLACAALFAVQILAVAHYAPRTDVLAMSCSEFLTGAALGLPFLLLPSERAMLCAANLRAALPAIAFCGVFSSGIAYTLQNVAQGRVAPAVASLLMSLESVFALLFGRLFLGDAHTPRQLLGCALLFAAVLWSQLVAARK